VAELVHAQCRYDVSLEVAARAWAEVHGRECALFYWTSEDERLQIQWTNATARVARARLKALGRFVVNPKLRVATRGEASLLLAQKQALVLANSALGV
jgi:hypothetical protein